MRIHPTSRKIIAVVAVVSIIAGLAIIGSIAAFYYHSDTGGHALEQSLRSKITKAQREAATQHGAAPHCAAFSDSAPGAQGLVRAASIQMSAPVVGSDGDAQLSDAVGHVAGSPWPGSPGTSVLAAHDVTYFSRIDLLNSGDTVQFVTPCATYLYRVVGHEVVHTGSPVYSSPSQSLLVLETCYPLNALFLTSQRYLVDAVYVGARSVGAPLTSVTAAPAVASVPAPAALAQQGLTLATNDVLLGQLGLSGAPAPSWQQSPLPLDDETSALSAYIAALHTGEQGQDQWWSQIAPTTPFAQTADLRGATITGYVQPLNPILDVSGSTWTGAQLSAVVDVSGGSRPGTYTIDATVGVAHGQVLVTGWTMTPST